MPRVYIQWLVAFGFGSIGAFPAVDFGYAEGSYPPPSGSEEFSSAVDRYETVPLLNGSGGMGEEKFLIVGIGGDADMFYGLVDEFSPERIAVLVPRAAVTHTSIPFLTSRLQNYGNVPTGRRGSSQNRVLLNRCIPQSLRGARNESRRAGCY